MEDVVRFRVVVDELSLDVDLKRSGDQWVYTFEDMSGEAGDWARNWFRASPGVLCNAEGRSAEDLRVAVEREVVLRLREAELLWELWSKHGEIGLIPEADADYRPSDGKAVWFSLEKYGDVAIRVILVYGVKVRVELFRGPPEVVRMGKCGAERTEIALTWDPDAQVWKGEEGRSAVETLVAMIREHLSG